MQTSALVRELLSNGSLLMKRQLALARIEARRDVKQERKSLELMGVAAAIGYGAIVLNLVAAALAIGEALGHSWAGALIVGGTLLLVGFGLASIGWFRRVQKPLSRTRNELTRERTWATSLTT
jgi:hypothetical protein